MDKDKTSKNITPCESKIENCDVSPKKPVEKQKKCLEKSKNKKKKKVSLAKRAMRKLASGKKLFAKSLGANNDKRWKW